MQQTGEVAGHLEAGTSIGQRPGRLGMNLEELRDREKWGRLGLEVKQQLWLMGGMGWELRES